MYNEIIEDQYEVEYTVIDNKTIFVHYFRINEQYRGLGYSYKVFDKLKEYGLPILLECECRLEEFYKKLGFQRDCIGREGFLEMIYRPETEG